jgi:hypothetical protein
MITMITIIAVIPYDLGSLDMAPRMIPAKVSNKETVMSLSSAVIDCRNFIFSA